MHNPMHDPTTNPPCGQTGPRPARWPLALAVWLTSLLGACALPTALQSVLPGSASPPAAGGSSTPPSAEVPARLAAQRQQVEAALTGGNLVVLATSDGRLQINPPSDFSFGSNSAEVTPAMRPVLDQLASGLAQPALAGWPLLIVGFTDSDGPDEANAALSLARADSVRRHLQAKGLAASRLRTEGRGEDAPVASNSQRYGKALNRRVEFYLTPAAAP